MKKIDAANLVALCDTTSSTEVGVRAFSPSKYDSMVEIVCTDMIVHLSLEDMSLWQRIKLLLGLAFMGRYECHIEPSLLLDRNAAIALNDELIDALYYDESGNHVG